jgi:hypothetical protein
MNYSQGFDLYGKTDAKFVDGAFRFFREHLAYFPSLTTTQFLSPQHFRERKLMLLADIVPQITRLHIDESRKYKQKHTVWIPKSSATNAEKFSPRHRVPVGAGRRDKDTTDETPTYATPWISMNLEQPKHTRVIRHMKPAIESSRDSSDVHLPVPADTMKPRLDWDPSMDGATYKTVETAPMVADSPVSTWWMTQVCCVYAWDMIRDHNAILKPWPIRVSFIYIYIYIGYGPF